MKGIAAESKSWSRVVRARYARRRPMAAEAEFTLLRPAPSATSLLQPILLNFRADFHLRAQHRSFYAAHARERIHTLRETVARQPAARTVERREPEALPAVPPRVQVMQANRTMPIRESAPAVVSQTIDCRTTLPTHTVHRAGCTTAITHVLTRREVVRLREAFRRDEREPRRPNIQFRTPAAKTSAEGPPEPPVTTAARREGGAATPEIPGWRQLPIEAIADQVINQIDRRLVAHRERMGRV